MDEDKFRLNMETQVTNQILFAILGIASGASGWWLRVLYEKLEQLRKDHEALKVDFAGNGVKRVDLQLMMREFKEDSKDRHSELKKDIEKLFDVISKKQDKP